MKTPTYPLRNTQSISLTEFLQDLDGTLLFTAGQKSQLGLLGADRDGLIRHDTAITGMEAAAGREEQVAVWGRRRLEFLSRGTLLEGKMKRLSGRLFPFIRKTAAEKHGSIVDLQWGREGLWGVGRTSYGLLDKLGHYTRQDTVIGTGSQTELSGLAMKDDKPAFLTSKSITGYKGCIHEAQSGEIVFTGMDAPSSPLLIDSTLYILEGPSGQVISCDLERGTRTTAIQLPGPANKMIRFGNQLLISLIGNSVGLCYLHLDSGNLTVLEDSPTYDNIRLLNILDGRLQRSHQRPSALKAASVAAATALVLTQSPVTANAGDIIFTEIKSSIPLLDADVGRQSKPTFVDIDDDGDLDAFIGERYGAVKYFENTGTNTAPVYVERTGTTNPLNAVDVGNRSTPAFVDINGDGDFDAFIGEYNGTVKFFENTGTNTAPVFVERTGIANPLGSVDVGWENAPSFIDIDGDGDFDVFIGEEYGTINYFENTGTNTAPVFVERTGTADPLFSVDVGYSAIPTFVDIDGDGDFDAFIGEKYGTVKYFENTGTNTAPVFVERTGSANPLDAVQLYYTAPTFADIDGDGDFDAFVGEEEGKIFAYRNNGTVNTPDFSPWEDNDRPLGFVRVNELSRPTFVDIDGDGDQDAFVGEMYGAARYYQNTGNESTPAFVEQTGTDNPLNVVNFGYGRAPAFVDIDGDGDFDAFVGEFYGAMRYYENVGSKNSPDFVERTGSSNPLPGAVTRYLPTPTFVDIDGDGDFDVFIGEYFGTVKFYENIGTSREPAFAELIGCSISNPLGTVDVGYTSTPTFVDIDGDGDYDAFIGEKYGTLKYYENTGSRSNPDFVEQTGSSNPLVFADVGYTSAPTFVDIDGDKDYDAFIGDYQGRLNYFRNDSPIPVKKFPWIMFMPAITGQGK